jgi:hypothetical protein
MLNRVVRFIVDLLIEWCKNHKRAYVIYGDSDRPYLMRYLVVKNPYVNVFIHKFLRSDDPFPHDHPWNFWSYVVSGGYTEQRFDRAKAKHNHAEYTQYWTQSSEIRLPGSLAYRKFKDIHLVDLDRTYGLDELDLAPTTICVTGRRLQEWGFWLDDRTYLDWREFLKIRSVNDSRIRGSE